MIKALNWNSITTYTAVGVMIIFSLRPSVRLFEQANASGFPVTPAPEVPATPTTSPRLLKFNLSLSSPQDLKVKQGDAVTAGEILADRVEERSRLSAQHRTLELSLKEIQGKIAVKPTAPVAVPTVNELPPVSFAEEETAIANAKLAVQQATREFEEEQEKFKSAPKEESSAVRKAEIVVNEKQRQVDIQHRKIDMVQSLKDLPPDVLVHEQEVLKQRQAELQQATAELEEAQAKEQTANQVQTEKLQKLAQEVEKAQAELQLAISKLQTAKDKRAYTEYEASITAARRVEEHNQAEQNYTRQLQESEQQERDRSFQAAQIQSKIAEIDNQLDALGIVRSFYTGTVRHIKVVEQTDKNLSIELILAVSSSSAPTLIPSSGSKPKNFSLTPTVHQ